ncbi:phage tail family protein 1 [Achromobacter xylosoxidans A8]|uniref:Phage tail family protein 1 n=1 Tax=Achromobacter xylosoxidans (strain A8) TaxID=762376 RepID=E3HSM2_ACHXA|nr:phage tail protein [Achromobacter xylosoxidans]ADP17339.1 phage tail family protein 1 [Achromobacter xylosoxidans A8]
MSSIFINGTQFRVSKTISSIGAISAITNAKNPVASAVTVPTDGDILVVNSGWPALDETVWRATAAAAGSFELEGADTTPQRLYPQGKGAGFFRKVTDWFSLDQIQDVQITGGEQQNYQYQYVEDPRSQQLQKPTFKTPVVLTFTLDYDRKKEWYGELIAADILKSPVVVEGVYPDGSVVYYYGFPSFNKNPVGGTNANLQNTFALSLRAETTTYDGAQ